MSEIGMADAIALLRAEVTTAMIAAEGQSLQFELSPIEVELQIQLSNEARASAGVKWVVVSIGADAKMASARSHKIRFTLTPQQDGRPVKVNAPTRGEPG